MSMARLVITAVTVEGRSKSEVARDYGISRVWVQKLVHRFQTEGEAAFEPRSRRPHPIRGRSVWRWRTGSCGCARRCRRRASTRARRRSLRTCRSPGLTRCRRSRRSGGSCPAAGSSSRSRRNGPASRGRPFCAEQPNERWQADITHWRLADGSGGGDPQHPRRPLPGQHRR